MGNSAGCRRITLSCCRISQRDHTVARLFASIRGFIRAPVCRFNCSMIGAFRNPDTYVDDEMGGDPAPLRRRDGDTKLYVSRALDYADWLWLFEHPSVAGPAMSVFASRNSL